MTSFLIAQKVSAHCKNKIQINPKKGNKAFPSSSTQLVDWLILYFIRGRQDCVPIASI